MTNQVKIANKIIGGGNPVLVQTMTNARGPAAIIAQINLCAARGADIVRLAVTCAADAAEIPVIKRETNVPLVADIQFDWRLAVKSIESGIDKIRINPGNIPAHSLREVVAAAKEHNVPIRVGVNGGSAQKSIVEKHGGITAAALAESALGAARLIEDCNYDKIVLAVKSSSVRLTVDANRLLSASCSYPLHIGITEAGTPKAGLAKSYAGIGALLLDGIGDTIRISLTAAPEVEVDAALSLLNALRLRRAPEIISCPTCARCDTDIEGIARQLGEYVRHIDKPLRIAVMGCVVNGPGEAREADIGLAGGGNGKTAIFKKGEIFTTVSSSEALPFMKRLIDELIND